MSLHAILADLNPWWADRAARPAALPMVRRALQPIVMRHLVDPSDRRAVVLYGPRQVGKSTLVQQVIDDLLVARWPASGLTYFDFSDERIGPEPASLRAIVETRPAREDGGPPRIFLLDDVEHAAEGDGLIAALADSRADRFLLTSSTAGPLGPIGSGYDAYRLDSLNFAEYLRIISGVDGPATEDVLRRMPRALPSYLAGSGFPEHIGRPAGEVRRRLRQDIAERAILRDLLRLGVDVQRIKDLFVWLAQTSGEQFDARRAARLLDADPRSVRHWVELLEATGLIVRLRMVTNGRGTGARARTRLYAADHGLVSAFLPGPSPHEDPTARGALLRAAVFRHLRELPGTALHYYQPPRGRLASDFVIDRDGRRTVLTVTVGQTLQPGESYLLRSAGKRLGAAACVAIHGGTEAGDDGGVRLLPLHRFLLDPALAAAADDNP